MNELRKTLEFNVLLALKLYCQASQTMQTLMLQSVLCLQAGMSSIKKGPDCILCVLQKGLSSSQSLSQKLFVNIIPLYVGTKAAFAYLNQDCSSASSYSICTINKSGALNNKILGFPHARYIAVCCAATNYDKFKNAQTFTNEEMQFQDDWKFS